MIDEVEELRPELNPGALRESEVLENGEVDADVSGTADRVAAYIAELPVQRDS